MSLPSAPLVPTANDPQGVGHPSSISQGLTLLTNGPDTSLLLQQENITTPGASCSIALAGGPVGAAGSFPGMANYTLFKGCGPSAGGVNQDALHLYRYGPTGAVNPTISQVIQIAPKMAATPGNPSDNLMQIFSDLTIDGTLTVGNNTLKTLPAPILYPYIVGGAGGNAVTVQASSGAGTLRGAMLCRSANPLVSWASMVDGNGIPYSNCKAVRVTVVGSVLNAAQIAGTSPIPYTAYAHAVGVSNSSGTTVESDFWVSIVDNVLVGGGTIAQDWDQLPQPLNAGPCFAGITTSSTAQAALSVPQGFPPGGATLYPSPGSTYLPNAPTLSAVVSVAGSPNGVGIALGGYRQGANTQPGDTQFSYQTAQTNVYFLLQPIA